MTLDERTRAAVARLTNKERECLHRRLRPQTAKEMALDLGVSPHAVEKRLKMARTKLGVNSSIAAARLLVAAEAYQQLGPHPSDLASAEFGGEKNRGVALLHFAKRPRPFLILMGATLMTILLAAALTLGAVDPQAGSPQVTEDGGFRKADQAQTNAFLLESFELFDRDGSGFLDMREVSALEPRNAQRDPSLKPPPAGKNRDIEAETKWMAKLDTDRDGHVSTQEYVGYMMPWALLSGVPIGWKPGTAPRN